MVRTENGKVHVSRTEKPVAYSIISDFYDSYIKELDEYGIPYREMSEVEYIDYPGKAVRLDRDPHNDNFRKFILMDISPEDFLQMRGELYAIGEVGGNPKVVLNVTES